MAGSTVFEAKRQQVPWHASNAVRDDEGVLLSKMRIAVGAVSLDTFKQGFRETASANETAGSFGANGP
jgi:hypothetical protein